MSKKRGGTLLDLLIGVTLSLLIFGATIVTLNQGFTAFRIAQEKTKSQEAARIALEESAIYIRSASAAPEIKDGCGNIKTKEDNKGVENALTRGKGNKIGLKKKDPACSDVEVMKITRRDRSGNSQGITLQQSGSSLTVAGDLNLTTGYSVQVVAFTPVGDKGAVKVDLVTGNSNYYSSFITTASSRIIASSIGTRSINLQLDGCSATGSMYIGGSCSNISLKSSPTAPVENLTIYRCTDINDSSCTETLATYKNVKASEEKTASYAPLASGTYYFMAKGAYGSSYWWSTPVTVTVSTCSTCSSLSCSNGCSSGTTGSNGCTQYTCCDPEPSCSCGSSVTGAVNGCNTYTCNSCPTPTPTPTTTVGGGCTGPGTDCGSTIYTCDSGYVASEADTTSGTTTTYTWKCREDTCNTTSDCSGQCSGGQTWSTSTKQCECSTGNWDGSSCVTCTGGQTWSTSTKQCECPFPQKLVSGKCECPKQPDCGSFPGIIIDKIGSCAFSHCCPIPCETPPAKPCTDAMPVQDSDGCITSWVCEHTSKCCDGTTKQTTSDENGDKVVDEKDAAKLCEAVKCDATTYTDCYGDTHSIKYSCGATKNNSSACDDALETANDEAKADAYSVTSTQDEDGYCKYYYKDPCAEQGSKELMTWDTAGQGKIDAGKWMWGFGENWGNVLESGGRIDMDDYYTWLEDARNSPDGKGAITITNKNNEEIEKAYKKKEMFLKCGDNLLDQDFWFFGFTKNQHLANVTAKRNKGLTSTTEGISKDYFTVEEDSYMSGDSAKFTDQDSQIKGQIWNQKSNQGDIANKTKQYLKRSSDYIDSYIESRDAVLKIEDSQTFGSYTMNYKYKLYFDAPSPILLDLAGIGMPDVAYGAWLPHPEMFDRKRAKVFDMTGEGYFVLTEWVGPNSGLLCTLDEKGKVSTALQLFGTAGGWSDGYAKLSKLFDKDKNGIVEGNELDGLYVWHDRNMDAMSDPDELKPVGEWGITRIWARHDKFRSIFERNSKKYFSWDWWPSATLIKPEDRNELLKGVDITKMHVKARPIELQDILKIKDMKNAVDVRGKQGKENVKNKKTSSTPFKDVASNPNNDLPKPQKNDVPNPVSSPYIAMTQNSDYNFTQFKKRRGK